MIYIFMKFSIDCPIQSLQAHASLYKFYLSAIKAGPRGYAPMIINEEGNRKEKKTLGLPGMKEE